jgi:hypothetical protein
MLHFMRAVKRLCNRSCATLPGSAMQGCLPAGLYVGLCIVPHVQTVSVNSQQVTAEDEEEEIHGSRRSLALGSRHSLDSPKHVSNRVLDIEDDPKGAAPRKTWWQRLPWYKPTEEEKRLKAEEKANQVCPGTPWPLARLHGPSPSLKCTVHGLCEHSLATNCQEPCLVTCHRPRV